MSSAMPSAAVLQVVETASGPVEIGRVPGDGPTVLFFPGGHCSAGLDCGWSAYSDLGFDVLAFSRPGYGRTDVGPLSPASFAPIVRDVCQHLDVTSIAASVGVSFGGMQAVHAAADTDLGVQKLVLHSAAPSSLPYPDGRAERIAGPVAFSPRVEAATWWLVRRLTGTDAGLRLMMGQLSTLPAADWWAGLTATDRQQARRMFSDMRSRSGFVTDLRSAKPADSAARRAVLERIAVPALVTASRFDGGVSFVHALDYEKRLKDVRVVETSSPTHLFWLGPAKAEVTTAVRQFLLG